MVGRIELHHRSRVEREAACQTTVQSCPLLLWPVLAKGTASAEPAVPTALSVIHQRLRTSGFSHDTACRSGPGSIAICHAVPWLKAEHQNLTPLWLRLGLCLCWAACP